MGGVDALASCPNQAWRSKTLEFQGMEDGTLLPWLPRAEFLFVCVFFCFCLFSLPAGMTQYRLINSPFLGKIKTGPTSNTGTIVIRT